MPREDSWWRDHRRWVELFVLVNVAFLAVDIFLAHSVNQFREPAEYLPLYFSLAAPVVLIVAFVADLVRPRAAVWRDLGYLVGWLSITIGLAGVILHLDSRFFYDRTLQSLVYAAPFAAPLAYTGLGLLLVMNRMVPADSREWPMWVLLMALGGFFGNFVFSVTDHAQNGFYHWTEWIPVVSSALAVGFLTAPYLTPVTRRYLWLCGAVLLAQAVVGVLGFALHMNANLHGTSPRVWDNIIFGAPPLAPLLFPNLVLLAFISVYVLAPFLPVTAPEELAAPQCEPASIGVVSESSGSS
jgi:hypothetical protein